MTFKCSCYNGVLKRFVGITLFMIGMWLPSNVLSLSSLSIRLSLRNDNSLGSCNFMSVTILSTSETIYLKEMSSTIIRQSPSNPVESGQNVCLYQEVTINPSRIISLSSANNTFSAFIALGSSRYYIDRGSIAIAVVSIDLAPYEQLVEASKADGHCGVDAPKATLPFEALTEFQVSYVNNTITDYYVELYIVADVDMFKQWGAATESTIYQIVNHVNALYRAQGVHLFVVAIEVWKTTNAITVVPESGVTLANLARYRTTLTTKHDLIHLISGITFNNQVLGLAYMGGLCQFTFGAAYSQDRTATSVLLTASTMAHEIGHNFGQPHDGDGCTCAPDTYCLMNAYSFADSIGLKWSTCSLATFAKNLPFFQSTRCLQDIPNLRTINNANLCGNGVIDPYEDCDPGVMNTASSCCDPTRCKFTTGSTCASGRCCNKNTCQPFVAGTVCRSPADQCDLPEYCDGYLESCPDDRYKTNASPCSNAQGYCYNGVCRSRDLQCQTVMFSSSINSASTNCYSTLNVGGTYDGFCNSTFAGYSDAGSALFNFLPCDSADVNCGSLHCNGFTANTIFSNLSKVAGAETCIHMLFNTNLTGTRDFNLVANGAPCDTNKWCMNSKCQTVPVVPTACNSRGALNDLGNCHCDNGYSGFDCSTTSGCGGSVDSGPPCANIAVPSTCPASYCQNGGSCILNTNGTQCAFNAPFCCYCTGNYLEPNCATASSKNTVLTIKSSTTFVADYSNPASDAFKQFERNVCQLTRMSFRRYFGTQAFACQVSNLANGSVVAATLIQGDSLLPSNGYQIADTLITYCRLGTSTSQSLCNNNLLSLASVSAVGTPTNSCTSANVCASTYTCTLIASSTYQCVCPSGYRNAVPTYNLNNPPCTQICVSNATQCSNNGICQENNGTSISCVCNSGYSGQSCEKGSMSTTTIIIIVVVCGSAIIIVAIIIVVVIVRKKKANKAKPHNGHAVDNRQAPVV